MMNLFLLLVYQKLLAIQLTEKEKFTYTDHYGYPVLKTWLTRNKSMDVKIHRILGMLFIPIPDELKNLSIAGLLINHKDGIKTNLDLKNLEWCTYEINNEHARQVLGLGKIDIPVLRRDINTNEIVKYKSIAKVSKDMNIDHRTLSKHFKSKTSGAINYNGFSYKKDDNNPWPSILKDTRILN